MTLPETSTAGVMSGQARVFIDPEPERGAHTGIRGLIVADALGVHTTDDCEWLMVDNDSTSDDWPMGTWDYLEKRQTVPWHRVHQIEWYGDE
jgi:hypothetical protein